MKKPSQRAVPDDVRRKDLEVTAEKIAQRVRYRRFIQGFGGGPSPSSSKESK